MQTSFSGPPAHAHSGRGPLSFDGWCERCYDHRPVARIGRTPHTGSHERVVVATWARERSIAPRHDLHERRRQPARRGFGRRSVSAGDFRQRPVDARRDSSLWSHCGSESSSAPPGAAWAVRDALFPAIGPSQVSVWQNPGRRPARNRKTATTTSTTIAAPIPSTTVVVVATETSPRPPASTSTDRAVGRTPRSKGGSGSRRARRHDGVDRSRHFLRARRPSVDDHGGGGGGGSGRRIGIWRVRRRARVPVVDRRSVPEAARIRQRLRARVRAGARSPRSPPGSGRSHRCAGRSSSGGPSRSAR